MSEYDRGPRGGGEYPYGYGQGGSVVTAGGLVFVGSGSNVAGYFFAYDAKSGELIG